MKKSVREIISYFVQEHPGSTVNSICQGTGLESSTVYRNLGLLLSSHILTANRRGRENVYGVVPDIYLEEIYAPPKRSPRAEKAFQAEEQAKALLKRGFPRRAATVLTDALGLVCTESDVRRLAGIRSQCLKSARLQPQRDEL